MTKQVLKKLRDFRMKLQAEIAEMESYGIDITKRKDKLSKLSPDVSLRQRQAQEITLVNVK